MRIAVLLALSLPLTGCRSKPRPEPAGGAVTPTTLASEGAPGAASMTQPAVARAGAATEGGRHAVTLRQLAETFRYEPPMAVGFDIDDTVLDSAPAFYFGAGKYGETFTKRDSPFWTDLNDNLDAKLSQPRSIARLLIQLHKARGDRIVFISGRPPSNPESTSSRDLLKKLFKLDDATVVFTGFQSKTGAIQREQVKVYYGDSDTDMTDALAAGTGVRPVRILRAKASNAADVAHIGQLGEEVLLHSDE